MAKATHPRRDDRGEPDAVGHPPADRGARAAHQAHSALEVEVARTGGFAGITRRWTAQPPDDEASEWKSLIDRCPWDDARPVDHHDAASTPAAVPDGFVWWIRASVDAEPREAEVADQELTGAWRELVEAVRDWHRAVTQPGRDAP